jgi:molybdopterin-containing oxidoreductase family membrane subunit
LAGVGYYQFRLVDWDWACRNGLFDLFAHFTTKMENSDQPRCRSNDGGCRGVCGFVPITSHGAPWLFFFIFPYPNTRGPLWVNFNSPLFWDFVAISAYLLISASFWYFGMVPDFATIRDTTKSKIKKAVYGFFAFGWTGSTKEWLRYEGLAFVLGGIAAVLVVSVHSIVSTDFAVSVEPGWHTTIFPPYFVVGAIFSGFAMVLTLVVLMRKLYRMENFITDSHVDAVCRILIFISLIMGTAYITEIFIAWYSGSPYECLHFSITALPASMRYSFGECSFSMPLFLSCSGLRRSVSGCGWCLSFRS